MPKLKNTKQFGDHLKSYLIKCLSRSCNGPFVVPFIEDVVICHMHLVGPQVTIGVCQKKDKEQVEEADDNFLDDFMHLPLFLPEDIE